MGARLNHCLQRVELDALPDPVIAEAYFCIEQAEPSEDEVPTGGSNPASSAMVTGKSRSSSVCCCR